MWHSRPRRVSHSAQSDVVRAPRQAHGSEHAWHECFVRASSLDGQPTGQKQPASPLRTKVQGFKELTERFGDAMELMTGTLTLMVSWSWERDEGERCRTSGGREWLPYRRDARVRAQSELTVLARDRLVT